MYQKMLVPLDGSEMAESVFPHVLAIAKGCGITQVFLLRVVEPIPVGEGVTADFVDKVHRDQEQAATSYLADAARRLREQGLQVQTEVEDGLAGEKIAEFVEQRGMDLVVMATHGRSGIGRWVFGSVADKVLRSVSIPLLLIRGIAKS